MSHESFQATCSLFIGKSMKIFMGNTAELSDYQNQ